MKNSEFVIRQFRGDRLLRSFTPSGDKTHPWRMDVGDKSYLRTNGWVLSKILPTLLEGSPISTVTVPFDATDSTSTVTKGDRAR